MARQSLVSYCGLYCGACPEDDKNCPGCKIDNENSSNPDCKFKKCNRDKGLSICSECKDFPCIMVKNMSESQWAHHRTALPNLLQIKETGLDNWLKEQKEKHTCKSCGARIFWYRKCCDAQAGK